MDHVNWLTPVGGLAVLVVAVGIGGSAATLASEVTANGSSLVAFAVVALVAVAVVGLGIAGRRNAGTYGEPYW